MLGFRSKRVAVPPHIWGGWGGWEKTVESSFAPKSPGLPETGFEGHCSARGGILGGGAEDRRMLLCFVSYNPSGYLERGVAIASPVVLD